MEAHPPPPADMAIVGFGWAGSIVAAELAKRRHGLVVFERGPMVRYRSCGYVHELGNERWTRTRVQHISRETYALRYAMRTTALPLLRRLV
jgi:gluconate 2-dehydrogenase alpha chain